MLVHLAGSVPGIVGEHDAGGREILSLPLAAATVAGTSATSAQRHIQSGQFLGNGTCPAATSSSSASAAANARGTRTARR